jgi:Ca2+-binding EF-hand superfamily protein
LDSNGDNKISKTEAKGPLKDNFDKVDSNGDGYISVEELQNRRQGR